MKKFLLFTAFVLISIESFSQDPVLLKKGIKNDSTPSSELKQGYKKHYLGGHFSFGKANYNAERLNFLNDQEYSGKYYFTLAFDYAYRTSNNTAFITGLSATSAKMDFTNTVYYSQGSSSYTYNNSLFIFSVPVGIRHYFEKYFYFNTGIAINYHPNNGYTWGLGGFFGLGAEYEFKSGLLISFTPQVQLNKLDLSNSNERLIQIGFNIGVGYRF